MRRTILALTILIASSALAQNRFVYPVPDDSAIAISKGNVYRSDLRFDLYRPKGNATVPVVVFANIGSREYTGWPGYIGWGKAVAGSGLAAVIYQATQESAPGDFDALMGALQKRAEEFHIDPNRVIVWSGSSNVLIGLPVAMDRKRDYIRAAVVYYGAADVADIRQDLPLLYVRSGLDSPQLNARIDALIGRALAANVPWTIESNGAAVHAFDIFDDNDVSREIIGRTLSFMKDAVRLAPAYAALSDRAAVGAAFARREWPQAIAGYRRLLSTTDSDAESHRRLGLALLETRQYAEALPELERAWELGRRGARDTMYPAAMAAAGVRNVERTIHWLEQVLSTPFGPPIAELRTSEAFAAVRDDPSFQQLLSKYEKK